MRWKPCRSSLCNLRCRRYLYCRFQKDDAGNRILEYAKDTLVAELTTDETGSATIKNLPLGNYRVVEKQHRMVLYIRKQSRMCSLSMWIRILLPWWKA